MTLNIFDQHTSVHHNGQLRYFRTEAGAERFLAAVGKRQASLKPAPPLPACNAWECHMTAQKRLRQTEPPACLRSEQPDPRGVLVTSEYAPTGEAEFASLEEAIEAAAPALQTLIAAEEVKLLPATVASAA
jgi:hypothetical protein